MAKKGKGEGDKKGSKKKLIALVLVAVVAYKFVGPGKSKPAPADKAAAATVEEGAVLPLPDLTLNLADPQPRYLRVGIALILEKGTSVESMKEEAPIASDVAVDVLSSKTFEELHRPGGKEEAKRQLTEKVREAFHGKKVARVIFTSFVMQ
jgi:flagellar FliL protein